MKLSMEQMRWIRERTWARFLFYGVVAGLPIGLAIPFIVFFIVEPISEISFEAFHLGIYILVTFLGVIWATVWMGGLLLWTEKSVHVLNQRLVQKFKSIELEAYGDLETSSVGTLEIRNPLQWIPPTILDYLRPQSVMPWICFIDDRPLASFNYGETVTLQLPVGRHQVCVGRRFFPVQEKLSAREVNFTQTVQVDIRAGQTVTLVFKFKRLQIAWLILAMVGLFGIAWSPPVWLEAIWAGFPGYKINNPAFLPCMIRVIFMYVCFGPVFYWFISSRFKKRGFMTVLTFAKPDNQGELVEPDAKR